MRNQRRKSWKMKTTARIRRQIAIGRIASYAVTIVASGLSVRTGVVRNAASYFKADVP
jgi:hypothetical protein